MADGWSSYIDSNQSDTDAPYGVVTDQIPSRLLLDSGKLRRTIE
jgi:hypothetical protein